jgi:hypothetical protein
MHIPFKLGSVTGEAFLENLTPNQKARLNAVQSVYQSGSVHQGQT